MTARQPEGAWYGRSPNHYVTRGADCFWQSGWYAHAGRKVRGPLSSLGAAMEAADRMLAEPRAPETGGAG